MHRLTYKIYIFYSPAANKQHTIVLATVVTILLVAVIALGVVAFWLYRKSYSKVRVRLSQ